MSSNDDQTDFENTHQEQNETAGLLQSDTINLTELLNQANEGNNRVNLNPPPFKCKLEWKNINLNIKYNINSKWYQRSVYKNKQVLKNMSGSAVSGEMWIIMGPTGGGKSSLLNVLSNRKKRGVTGEILVNGKQVDNFWKQKIGYVVQDDILFPTLTVYQTFIYQAELRLPKEMSSERKTEIVNSFIETLGLSKSKNTLVGNSVIPGISGGERKRVSIGIQLLADTGVIFLDEPTSGLDKSTATHIVGLISQFSQKGYLVLTTIHQPSRKMYNMFDKVIFLVAGELVYQGPAKDAEKYFSNMGLTCPPDENPIDNVMEAMLNSNSARLQEILIKNWQKTSSNLKPYNRNINYEQKKFKPYQAGFANQFFVLGKRSLQLNLISLFSSLNIIQIVVIGTLFGLIWLRVPKTTETINERVGALFFIILFAGGFNPVLNVLYSFPAERSVVVRERSEGAYPISVYFLAKTLSDAPFEQIFPLLFLLISWWIVGLDDKFTTFLLVWVVIIFLCLSSSGLGLMISSLINDVRSSTIFATIYLLAMVMTAGFYIPWIKIPVWLRWLGYLSYLKYAFDGLVYIVIGDPKTFPKDGGRQLTLFVRNYGATIGILIGFAIFFRILAYTFLRLKFKNPD